MKLLDKLFKLSGLRFGIYVVLFGIVLMFAAFLTSITSDAQQGMGVFILLGYPLLSFFFLSVAYTLAKYFAQGFEKQNYVFALKTFGNIIAIPFFIALFIDFIQMPFYYAAGISFPIILYVPIAILYAFYMFNIYVRRYKYVRIKHIYYYVIIVIGLILHMVNFFIFY